MLNELLKEHGPTRDDVVALAREEARLETEKYKKEQAEKSVQITFHADRRLDFNQQKFYCGGYLFLQYIYYGLQLDKTCRKIRDKYDLKFGINAFCLISFITEFLILQANARHLRWHRIFLNHLHTDFMMFTGI